MYIRTCTKTCAAICFRKTSVYWSGLYIRVCYCRKIVRVSLCLVPFQRRQIVLSRKACRSIYVQKVMKLLAFIFEQPSYMDSNQVTLYFEHMSLFSFTATSVTVHARIQNACQRGSNSENVFFLLIFS